jgi:N-acetylneuraminate epimerase
MRKQALMIATIVLVTTASNAAEAGDIQWLQLPSLPNPVGLAGTFAGVSEGVLLVGGGANFPDKMPWEGGKKMWHGTVYVLSKTNGAWREVGKLPRPLGYGISVTTKRGVLCIGGADADRHYADVYLVAYSHDELTVKSMPSLPVAVAFGAGAMVGSLVYVAGGSEKPGEQAALNRFFALDLGKLASGWRELAACPGESRILPVAGSARGAFYFLGGAAFRPIDGKIKRVYLRDAWRFNASGNWDRLADLPNPCVAAPTPAPVVDSKLLLVGGDDGTLTDFLPRDRHPGFTKTIQAFDIRDGTWSQFGEAPTTRATLPMVEWNGLFVLPSGEVRPGVRSPEVWAFRVEGKN